MAKVRTLKLDFSERAADQLEAIVDYPYVAIYKVLGEPEHTIMVLGVFHAAQGERKL